MVIGSDPYRRRQSAALLEWFDIPSHKAVREAAERLGLPLRELPAQANELPRLEALAGGLERHKIGRFGELAGELADLLDHRDAPAPTMHRYRRGAGRGEQGRAEPRHVNGVQRDDPKLEQHFDEPAWPPPAPD